MSTYILSSLQQTEQGTQKKSAVLLTFTLCATYLIVFEGRLSHLETNSALKASHYLDIFVHIL